MSQSVRSDDVTPLRSALAEDTYRSAGGDETGDMTCRPAVMAAHSTYIPLHLETVHRSMPHLATPHLLHSLYRYATGAISYLYEL